MLLALFSDPGRPLIAIPVSTQTVRNSLSPLLANMVISPALIDTLTSTEPSDSWLQPVADLEKIILAVRSAPRTASRKDLEDAVEKLRIRVTGALRGFLIGLFTPYRTSISPNLSILQTSILVKYRSFFAFLQRHAARAAHEVQKAYVSTVQWYYETGFRRYVRALERIRARSVAKEDPIGVAGNAESPLSESLQRCAIFELKAVTAIALLSRRNMTLGLDSPRASIDASTGQAQTSPSQAEDTGIILAYMADERDFVSRAAGSRPDTEQILRRKHRLSFCSDLSHWSWPIMQDQSTPSYLPSLDGPKIFYIP